MHRRRTSRTFYTSLLLLVRLPTDPFTTLAIFIYHNNIPVEPGVLNDPQGVCGRDGASLGVKSTHTHTYKHTSEPPST